MSLKKKGNSEIQKAEQTLQKLQFKTDYKSYLADFKKQEEVSTTLTNFYHQEVFGQFEFQRYQLRQRFNAYVIKVSFELFHFNNL